MVTKSFARLLWNDKTRLMKRKEEYSKEIESLMIKNSCDMFNEKVLPSLLLAKECGNAYCASLYFGLASLIDTVSNEELQDKRIVMFSYGSGLASSMFSCKIKGNVEGIKERLKLKEYLEDRIEVTPESFNEMMLLREARYGQTGEPLGEYLEQVRKGSFVLERIDEEWRRSYKMG